MVIGRAQGGGVRRVSIILLQAVDTLRDLGAVAVGTHMFPNDFRNHRTRWR